MRYRVIVCQTKNKEWFVRVISRANHQKVFVSETYKTKGTAVKTARNLTNEFANTAYDIEFEKPV